MSTVQMPDSANTILVVDDDAASLSALFECLRRASYRVLVAQDGASALERAVNGKPALILLDVMMPDIDGFETCRRLKRNASTADIPVLFLTALSETNEKVRGFEAGAVDYLTKPFQWEEVLARVRTHLSLRAAERALVDANRTLEARVAERTAELESSLAELDRLRRKLQAENSYLQQEIGAEMRDVVGSSRALRAVLDQVARVALSDTTVLINGETGTGKELIARAVHDASPRRERPLVKLNCAAISAGLVESELFGHVKGAFTGALKDRPGLLRAASGGVLFLDEIGEMGIDEQTMLLRALEEKTFFPLGGDREVRSEFQLIAGTNRDLAVMVREGRFREDLLARINLWTFRLPSLRERAEDIEPNLEYELSEYARRNGALVTFSREARAHFLKFAVSADARWQGNFRDLNGAITRMATLAPGGRISTQVVEEEVERLSSTWSGWKSAGSDDGGQSLEELLGAEMLEEIDLFDRLQLAAVIKVCRECRTLSEAGRTLFGSSRERKKTANDADRLRKYLSRFSLSWDQLKI
jgi:transcriptional regulatory protein RtcR